jgi:hypothetical protein
MGISLQSALMIQGNEVMVDTYTDKTKTGYGFIVYLMKGKGIHTKIISTIPTFPYKSREEAETAGTNLVKKVRSMDLNNHLKGLQKSDNSKNPN